MARFPSLAALFAAVLLAPAPASAEPKAVVELFTSQGCSSCVPADAYFSELVKRDDVLALSLHVDYWDYLGWPDTLGRPESTERQKEYASVRGSRKIYTPQIIVNGEIEAMGSDRKVVERAISASTLPVPVNMRWGDGTVEIEVEGLSLPAPWPTTIRLVLFSSEVEVAIQRGENAGATIGYYNVVRAMRPIGMWDGAPVKITLPEDELMGDGVDGCAVIVQEDLPKGPGAILGAAELGKW
jgi:hypothetical protein